jgi:outer membrane protein OmpA-like peptidoglycan-associated protein
MKLYMVASATVFAMAAAANGYADEPQQTGQKADETYVEKVKSETDVTNSDRVLETHVYFEFDKADLDAEAKAALDSAAKWLSQNQPAVILLEGHADKVGDEAYNKKLGNARADASKAYLVSLGVDPAQIKIISYGEAVPAVDVEGKERKNRRIMLYAIDKKPIVETKLVQLPCPSPEPEKAEVVPVRGEEPADMAPVEEEKERAFDIDIIGGVGVTDTIDGTTRAITHPGGYWTVRAALNTKYVIGVEAAYVGSAQDLDDAEGFADTRLLGNGAEGVLRANILPGRFRPYVFGGGGFMHYNLTDAIGGSDTVATVPAGAGMDVRFANDLNDPGVLVDVRGTVRPAFGDELFGDRSTAEGLDDADLDSWSVSANAGAAF